MKNKIFVLSILIIALLSSCNNDKPMPKPRGYFKIDLPEKTTYKTYNEDCPFTFEIPSYAFIIKKEDGYCWMDLYFPSNNATVWLTYKTIDNDLKAHLEDQREFVYKHTVKADAIEEVGFVNDSAKVYGTLYNLKGNTASAVQFYLTDSTTHFLRGSLYFNVPPNKDSLAPVIDFIREDIIHLMESFRWK
jgi:gliding motility-associated lipoprotein GldD